MASLPRLPDPAPGSPVKAEHIRQLADAIKKCWVVPTNGGGLEAHYGANGVSLAAVRPEGPRVMFVTTTITAMSGSTTGVGQAADAVYDPATGDLTAGTGAPVDVRNYHEKSFLEGAIIEAVPRLSTLWAVDVDKCGNYQ